MNEQIGARLREVRKELGFKNQADLADELKVSPSSIHNYESGKRSPDAEFLTAMAGAGADVLYILTGQHSLGELSPDEDALLANYRALPEGKRYNLSEMAAALSEKEGRDRSKAG